MSREKVDIKDHVYDILSKDVNETTGRGFELKMMAWVVNDVEQAMLLANRETYKDKQGVENGGKMKGLKANDFLCVLRNIYRIAEHFHIPKHIIDEILEEVSARNKTVEPGVLF